MAQPLHPSDSVPASDRDVLRRKADGRLAVRVCWCCWLSVWLLSALAQTPASREYPIKAAFVYNFTKFVEWPARSFPANDSPLVIGVCGNNPIFEELQAVAQDHKVNGRGIQVKRVQSVAEAETAHLLFVASDEESEAGSILAAVRTSAVLTVGESEKFVAGGGMIRFVREADKVRFQINVEAAERAGLRISAQLRKLAQPERRQK